MIKVKQFQEGLSPILYHRTESINVAQMINEDQFFLTLATGVDTKGSKQRFYYMSTSRIKKSGYASSGDIILILDGRKLGERYAGEPIDYWGLTSFKTDEQEDRVFSDKPFIPDAHKYIMEIHIIVREDNIEYIQPNYRKAYTDIIENPHGIPVYLYKDQKAFELLDTRKAHTDLSIFDLGAEGEIADLSEYPDEKYPYYMKLVDVYHSLDNLSDDQKSILHQLGKIDVFEFETKLEKGLHNDRLLKQRADAIQRYVHMMKREGLKNYEDLYNFLLRQRYKVLGY